MTSEASAGLQQPPPSSPTTDAATSGSKCSRMFDASTDIERRVPERRQVARRVHAPRASTPCFAYGPPRARCRPPRALVRATLLIQCAVPRADLEHARISGHPGAASVPRSRFHTHRARRILRQVRRVVAVHRTCHDAGRFFAISIPSNAALGAPVRRTHAAIRARPSSSVVWAASPNTRRAFACDECACAPSCRGSRCGRADAHAHRARPPRSRARSSEYGWSAPMLNVWFQDAGDVDRLRHHRRHIVDVAERARLRPVAEDRHRLPLKDLVHEDADHVAIAISDVLTRAEDVVGPKDRRSRGRTSRQAPQFQLHGVLGDAVRVFGRAERRLRSSEEGARRRPRSTR